MNQWITDFTGEKSKREEIKQLEKQFRVKKEEKIKILIYGPKK